MRYNDGQDKDSNFYGLLSQIGGLSLMSRSPSKTAGLRKAPFIMTCVTATCFRPVNKFLADTHCNHVYLPLN